MKIIISRVENTKKDFPLTMERFAEIFMSDMFSLRTYKSGNPLAKQDSSPTRCCVFYELTHVQHMAYIYKLTQIKFTYFYVQHTRPYEMPPPLNLSIEIKKNIYANKMRQMYILEH